MRAVEIVAGVDGGGLRTVTVPDPRPGPGEVVIDVAAAGVNRADTSQRQGRYAPPVGASQLPGLECSGVISDLGAGVDRWDLGDEVCALLAGGGYAEKVTVPAQHVLPAPSSLTLVDAAALPEALATVWSNVGGPAGLAEGQTMLVHGGSSGIGTTAIQIGRCLGARVLVTAGDDEKLAACSRLGAEVAINYRTEDFAARVVEVTDGRGVDIVLDIVGADYLEANVKVLAPEGRLVVIGLQSGADARIDLRTVLAKRAVVTGSLLRSRPAEQKAAIVAAVIEDLLPHVLSGGIVPVIDSVFPFDAAMEAHRRIESSRHVGKILLVP